MFQVMLQMAKLGNYCVLDTISHDSTPMEMIEAILTKAVDLYNAIADGDGWNIQNKGGGGGGTHALNVTTTPKCWNCRKEGCSVGKCTERKDQARIKRNKDKFYNDRNANSGNQGSTNKTQDKRNVDKSSSEYQRKVWVNAGLHMDGGFLKLSCKTCGLNFTHSLGHHNKWKSGAWAMQANHPLYIHNAKTSKTVPGAPTQTPTLPPSAGTGGLAGTVNSSDTLTFSHGALETKLSTFERTSTDPNAGTVASAIRQLLLN
jgi:hypothetical protein